MKEELSVQQYAAILDFIEEDIGFFKECCEEGSVNFEQTLAKIKELAGQ